MLGESIKIIGFLFLIDAQISLQSPSHEAVAKAAYKSGEITEPLNMPFTLDMIKRKLKDGRIFNWQDPSLTDQEKKEMHKLFDAVEIMTSSRNRQPSNVQNIFASLRLVERVVKKQLKEGQISEELASRFKWEKLSDRYRRGQPTTTYYFDKSKNMRVFSVQS